MTTTHFHSRRQLSIAHEAAMRAHAEAATTPLATTNQAVLAILMSSAATEAFVHELGEYAPSAYSTALGPSAVLPEISECARILKQLEREPVTTKYLEASKALIGKAFDKGAAPFQDFKLLIDLRNAIMHIKPTVEGDWQPGERVTADLAQRKIALPNTGPGSFPWFDRIVTYEAARWAYNSALAMMRSLLELFPTPPGLDPLATYRQLLQFHKPIP
jgi:hypothetical protein